MSLENFSDAALLLVGHGSTRNAYSAAPVFQHAAALRGRDLFAQVAEGFWKQQPEAIEVLPQLTQSRVFIVPLLISDGYFSEKIIPRALGFSLEQALSSRVRTHRGQTLFYCRTVGSHESMTKVLLGRAAQVIEKFPFPRAPKPSDISLFIAGHGTEQDEQSRDAIDKQVALIRSRNLYAAVEPIFLDQEPRIATCYQTARTKYMVVVPFFISTGLHVQEDLPVMLGEPERFVKQRLERGQATWRNPTEKQGKLVWLAGSVGTEPALAEVILERVQEAAAWAALNPKLEGRNPKEDRNPKPEGTP